MKICVINNLYKPFQRGGAEVISEIILHGLKDLGHEVFVVTTRPYLKNAKTEQGSTKVYRLRSLYFDLDKIPFFIRIFWHFFDMIDVVSYFKMKIILEIEKPDLVITGNLKGLGFLCPLLLKKKQLTHIHILHDIQLIYPTGLMFWGKEGVLNTFLAKIYQKINRKLFLCLDNVVSPSKWLLEQHEKRGFFKKAKKIVLANPIAYETSKIKEDPVENNHVFTFLFIGHLTKAKGVNVLLEAYAKLKIESDIESMRLILAGGGCLDERNRKIAETNKVEILGFVDREKIKSLMNSSHFLVVPSLCYENSPTVIYEALLYGLPFITSNLGGAKELAKKFGGQVFEPGNVDDLARVMRRVIKKTSLKDEFKKYNSGKLKNYSVNVYIGNILKIIQ